MSTRLNMMYSDAIKSMRITHGITQQQLADAIGVSRSAIGMYESGTREPNFETCEAIADFFNCRLSDIISSKRYDDPQKNWPDGAIPIVRKTYKILGNIACGEPVEPDQSKDVVVSPYVRDADYILIAKGDSMINDRIHDGDLIFIKQQPTVDNGQIAAVLIDGETTLKHFYFLPETETVTLLPSNPAYRPIVYQGEDLSKIKVLGKVVAVEFHIP